ncbi:MAG: hypothetical protein LBF69_05115 [Prevotellaceae bacterium]|jgi:hypothetical protein|nr:hypothetical protein [Prevotellaceae bacterium]
MTTKFFGKNAFPSPWGRVREGLAFLFLLLWPFVLSAQNGVTVSNLEMDAGTVTFDVSWKKPMPVEVWSDSVWVFVDYNDAGVMKRLPLSAGATLTATSAPGVGKVIKVSGNDRGVWVVGNAKTASSGSFSATVQLLTATASTGGSESRPLHGACAYASNYPPVGEYISLTRLSFTGTPGYNIVLKNKENEMIYRTSGANFDILDGYTLVSFTDATGAPGLINCIPMSGYIDFAVPDNLPGGQQLSFSVAENPSTPDADVITYTWRAPDFNPDTHTGTPFNTTAPATPGVYPVTLTAHSMGYCDLPKTKDVPVVDCRSAAGWIGEAGVAGQCEGNSGGKIGI